MPWRKPKDAVFFAGKRRKLSGFRIYLQEKCSIAGIPDLARHSRTPEGDPIPGYIAQSNLRFQQWILDTCLRPYNQEWLDYQQEIALRHTGLKKNQTDGIRSAAYIPFHDIAAFIAVLNDTIKPYLAKKGHRVEEVEGMHRAWCKSLQMQIALWSRPYTDLAKTTSEWSLGVNET